jgi:hypothetical protein
MPDAVHQRVPLFIGSKKEVGGSLAVGVLAFSAAAYVVVRKATRGFLLQSSFAEAFNCVPRHCHSSGASCKIIW